MLNLQAIEEQLAKGDPKLQGVYLKLKARLTKAETPSGEVVLVNVNPVVTPEGSIELEPTVPRVETVVFVCPKCSKVCANGTGLSAHVRKCNA